MKQKFERKYFKDIPAEEFNYIKEMWGRDSF